MKFKHDRFCNWGEVQGAKVAAVTFCHLFSEPQIQFNLGFYNEGFWNQNGNATLPFLEQSFEGKYHSPVLNGRHSGFSVVRGKIGR